ncbi:alcohol dehydrogenase catalytic domain-containing protein [Nocardia goodfellowii]
MNGLAYHLDPTRGRAGLAARTQELPEPGPHQVLVEVRAAALNRRDLMLMDGTYPLPATPGVVPLSDGVGTVIAVGDKVTRAAVGDRGRRLQRPAHHDRRLAGPRNHRGRRQSVRQFLPVDPPHRRR